MQRPALVFTMLVLATAGVASAQSPVGGAAKKPSGETPPSERVDTRFGALFPGEELIRPSPEVDLPPAPATFQTRAQTCFEESRARDANTAGRLEISVTARLARVVNATVDLNTTGDPVLPECVLQRAIGFKLTEDAPDSQRWVFVVGAQ